MTPVLFTKHDDVERAIVHRFGPVERHKFFYRALLSSIPPGTPIWGNLPVPAAAIICAAGYPYSHIIIPFASAPGALTYESLSRNIYLRRYGVEDLS